MNEVLVERHLLVWQEKGNIYIFLDIFLLRNVVYDIVITLLIPCHNHIRAGDCLNGLCFYCRILERSNRLRKEAVWLMKFRSLAMDLVYKIKSNLAVDISEAVALTNI